MSRRSLLLVTGVGIALIAYQWAAARPLWLDEEMIALNIRDRPLADLRGHLWLDQSAPLGWLYLQRAVLALFGHSELALRAVPALFGGLTVAAAFVVGRRFLTTLGAGVFVLLCGSGEWMVFHAGELKPYTADTFFSLLLIAITGWAGSSKQAGPARHAIVAWGAIAAIAHWFSLGALLVIPACTVVLAASLRSNRDGLKILSVILTLVGASIAMHYWVNIGPARANQALSDYWAFAMPPDDSPSRRLRWLAEQLKPLASKPGGTTWWGVFWLVAAAGFVVGRSRALSAAAALAVASGFIFALFRLYPLYERLSLWMVPALYLGIAMTAQEAWGALQRGQPGSRRLHTTLGIAGLLAVLIVSGQIFDSGVRSWRALTSMETNHDTDDRAALAWLTRQRREGEALVTTRHALPAVWWYGGVPLDETSGRKFPDGGPILTAELYTEARGCTEADVQQRFARYPRILVYLGFKDTPDGFDDLLLSQLSAVGAVTAIEEFGGTSRAAVIDPSIHGRTDLFWSDAGKDIGGLLKGCLAFHTARMW